MGEKVDMVPIDEKPLPKILTVFYFSRAAAPFFCTAGPPLLRSSYPKACKNASENCFSAE